MSPTRYDHPALSQCVGRSRAIRAVLADVVRVADTRFPVLLEGPSGSGKELIASIIHRLSCEGQVPFEAVNCGAIPEPLLESELFGHVAGAFTGAVRAHRGLFERAGEGTVFLDEIAEMSPAAQVRLLRVLQEHTFVPVGGEERRRTRARVIAATNRHLETDVKRGRFREDLYYRLNVFPIRLPPLRERHEDVPLLIAHFLGKYASEHGRVQPRLHPSALRRLMVYSYPGNVRELQNIVSALLIEARGAAEIRDRHVVAVFSRHGLHEPLAPETPGGAEGDGKSGHSVGAWVLDQLRLYHFNLALAERMLASRRRDAGNPRTVPVCSRSALTYYLQGECLRALAVDRGNVDAALLRLAGEPALVPRVRGKAARIMRSAHQAIDGGGSTPTQRMIALRKAFAKVPPEYQPDLLHFCGESARGLRS
jgi:transcriptional regulator with GAF, ATPase, and Fis domain